VTFCEMTRLVFDFSAKWHRKRWASTLKNVADDFDPFNATTVSDATITSVHEDSAVASNTDLKSKKKKTSGQD
jgi:hypothetical protein